MTDQRNDNAQASAGHRVPASVSGVKALVVFDVFGTVVDWRSSIIRDGQLLGKQKGSQVDWVKFADAWRADYQPAMACVRCDGRQIPDSRLCSGRNRAHIPSRRRGATRHGGMRSHRIGVLLRQGYDLCVRWTNSIRHELAADDGVDLRWRWTEAAARVLP